MLLLCSYLVFAWAKVTIFYLSCLIFSYFSVRLLGSKSYFSSFSFVWSCSSLSFSLLSRYVILDCYLNEGNKVSFYYWDNVTPLGLFFVSFPLPSLSFSANLRDNSSLYIVSCFLNIYESFTPATSWSFIKFFALLDIFIPNKLYYVFFFASIVFAF